MRCFTGASMNMDKRVELGHCDASLASLIKGSQRTSAPVKPSTAATGTACATPRTSGATTATAATHAVAVAHAAAIIVAHAASGAFVHPATGTLAHAVVAHATAVAHPGAGAVGAFTHP